MAVHVPVVAVDLVVVAVAMLVVDDEFAFVLAAVVVHVFVAALVAADQFAVVVYLAEVAGVLIRGDRLNFVFTFEFFKSNLTIPFMA